MPPEEAAASGAADPGDSPGEHPDEVAIAIDNAGWHGVAGCERASRAAVLATLAAVGPTRPVEISILLTGDGALQALNQRYRGRDAPTNVLSFTANAEAERAEPAFRTADGHALLGDVAVAFETVAAEAVAQDKTLLDHLRHLVVHGTLHLLGHDHQDDVEASVMEAAERRILAGLGVADPYAGGVARRTA